MERDQLGVDYSTVLFREDQETLDALLAVIAERFEGGYLTADGHVLTCQVRELVKLEEVLDHVVIDQDLIELDERLYTFDEPLSFAEFRARYSFGSFGG